MSPTAVQTATVWVKNRATGLVHGMKAEFAAYYLAQIDPETGIAQYERASEPKAPEDTFDPKAAKAAQDLGKHQASVIQEATRGAVDAAILDSSRPYVQHGVPDAARMEVATGASEFGPTLTAGSDRRAVIGGEDPQARQEEALAAADTSQLLAELAARQAAGERVTVPDAGDPATISPTDAKAIAQGDTSSLTGGSGGSGDGQKPVSKMNRDELVAYAAAHGVGHADDATKAQIVEAIQKAGK